MKVELLVVGVDRDHVHAASEYILKIQFVEIVLKPVFMT